LSPARSGTEFAHREPVVCPLKRENHNSKNYANFPPQMCRTTQNPFTAISGQLVPKSRPSAPTAAQVPAHFWAMPCRNGSSKHWWTWRPQLVARSPAKKSDLLPKHCPDPMPKKLGGTTIADGTIADEEGGSICMSGLQSADFLSSSDTF
jgi:hypothetical protein